jgi:dTMP kinase
LEGVDGSGKTTQTRLLVAALRKRGLDVLPTREPGGTRLGERVRELLLDAGSPQVRPWAEALLFAAARAELVAEVVRPALEEGRWVVSDRFVDSSLAYQGVARGLGLDAIWHANAGALDACLPHLTVLLEVDPAVAWRRERHLDDRIEGEGLALQMAVAEGYRQVADRFPERVRTVDGDGSPEQVHARVMALVGSIG